MLVKLLPGVLGAAAVTAGVGSLTHSIGAAAIVAGLFGLALDRRL